MDVAITRDSLAEALNLISGTTISGSFYTLSVVLYCLSARSSYPQLWSLDAKIKRQKMLTLTLASIMMICATMDVVLSNVQRRIAYVDYGNLPGGPLGLEAAFHATTVTRVRFFVQFIANLLILGVLAWRVLVVWRGIPFVKPVTLFLYVANAGIAITLYASQYQLSRQLTSSVLTVPRIANKIFITSITLGTACLVLMTLMLVIRLLSVRWQHIRVMGKIETTDQYLSIVAILIESYALEAAWNIGFCVFCGLRYQPVDSFFDATVTQVDILTNLLVIYRVVSGRAWDRQTHHQLSTLQCTQSARSETVISRDGHSNSSLNGKSMH